MGLREDLRRFAEVGEQRREDLTDFIERGDLGRSGQDRVSVPIKTVDLPGFEYDPLDRGGVGQGDVEAGDPIDAPAQPGDGDDPGKPGEGAGEHGYYEMDPEEFAAELDEELGLDLDPKGKTVIEESAEEYTDVARAGPRTMLDLEFFFREGLKRKLATDFDEEYVREALRVEDWGPDEVFAWARDRHVTVSKAWIEEAARDLAGEPERWASVEEMEAAVEHESARSRLRRTGIDRLPFRREDERFRRPEVVEKRERNVVVVNIRDVSGSMREEKQELVERTFTPMDWYLQGKYDRAAFVYIAHDAEAWEVEREEFFGIRSGGGTRISAAYELAAEILESEYPWARWNRYVFAAGDSENAASDTHENVIPLMESMDVNRHAYVETQPNRARRTATHASELADHFSGSDEVVVAQVRSPGDVIDAIGDILSTTGEES